MCQLDGSGGNTNRIETHCRSTGDLYQEGDDNLVTYPYEDMPAAACKCLYDYRAYFTSFKIPRHSHRQNSNWTLWCMVNKCKLRIKSRTGFPIGYGNTGDIGEYGVAGRGKVSCHRPCPGV